jgi:hypothetical protein
LSAHGVTNALRTTYPKGHEYEGLPKPLSMADVEGGGKWGNRSDCVIGCHRMSGHPSEWMYTELHVLKVKEYITGGRCTPFDAPIKLRMSKDSVGYEYMGKDILDYQNKKVEQIEF